MDPNRTEPRTALQVIAERFYYHLTGQQLEAVVAAARAYPTYPGTPYRLWPDDYQPRASWRAVADAIAEQTDGEIALPAETLRRWYRRPELAGRALPNVSPRIASARA